MHRHKIFFRFRFSLNPLGLCFNILHKVFVEFCEIRKYMTILSKTPVFSVTFLLWNFTQKHLPFYERKLTTFRLYSTECTQCFFPWTLSFSFPPLSDLYVLFLPPFLVINLFLFQLSFGGIGKFFVVLVSVWHHSNPTTNRKVFPRPVSIVSLNQYFQSYTEIPLSVRDHSLAYLLDPH